MLSRVPTIKSHSSKKTLTVLPSYLLLLYDEKPLSPVLYRSPAHKTGRFPPLLSITHTHTLEAAGGEAAPQKFFFSGKPHVADRPAAHAGLNQLHGIPEEGWWLPLPSFSPPLPSSSSSSAGEFLPSSPLSSALAQKKEGRRSWNGIRKILCAREFPKVFFPYIEPRVRNVLLAK